MTAWVLSCVKLKLYKELSELWVKARMKITQVIAQFLSSNERDTPGRQTLQITIAVCFQQRL